MNGKDHSNLTSRPRVSLRSPIAHPAPLDHPARAIPCRINRSEKHSKMTLCNPRRINSYKTDRPQPPLKSIDPRNRGVGVLRVSKQLPPLRLWQSFQHVNDGSGPILGSTATLGCALWRLVTPPQQLLTRTGSLRLSGQAIACATRGARPQGQYRAYARVDTTRPRDIYEASP